MFELYAAVQENPTVREWWGEQLNSMQAAEPVKCQNVGKETGK